MPALIAWFADPQTDHRLFARRVHTQELCVDDICVTRDQFAEVFGSPQSAAAAGTPNVALPQEAPGGSSASTGLVDADTATTTTPSETVPITSATTTAANDNEPAVVEDAQTAVEPVQASDTLLVDEPAPAQSATQRSRNQLPHQNRKQRTTTPSKNSPQPAPSNQAQSDLLRYFWWRITGPSDTVASPRAMRSLPSTRSGVVSVASQQQVRPWGVLCLTYRPSWQSSLNCVPCSLSTRCVGVRRVLLTMKPRAAL